MDRLTGGAIPGDTWVVTGQPGVGLTGLALGLARETALRSDLRVTWLSTRDDPALLRERIRVAEGGHLAVRGAAGDLVGEQQERYEALDAAVDSAALTISLVASGGIFGAVQEAADDGTALVVVDHLHDLDLLGEIRSEAGGVWLVIVVPGSVSIPRTVRDQVGMLRVERDDLHDPQTDRAGEADVHWSAPGRRTRTSTVAFQGGYSRFVAIS